MYGNRHLFERVRNNPELRYVQEYNISCPESVKNYYEERTFLVGLEDLNPKEHFNHYQQVNKQYGRTLAFEKGLAKLFMVRSHQR